MPAAFVIVEMGALGEAFAAARGVALVGLLLQSAGHGLHLQPRTLTSSLGGGGRVCTYACVDPLVPPQLVVVAECLHAVRALVRHALVHVPEVLDHVSPVEEHLVAALDHAFVVYNRL